MKEKKKYEKPKIIKLDVYIKEVYGAKCTYSGSFFISF
jgi:hypothetical protein